MTMKKMFLILGIVVAGYTVKAQDDRDVQDQNQQQQDQNQQQDQGQMKDNQGRQQSGVPSDVSSALKEKYPDLKSSEVDWNREGNNYQAQFMNNGIKYEVVIDDSGNWVSTETQMTREQLPDKVKEGLKNSTYNNWDVNEVEKREGPREKSVYIIEVEKGDQDYNVYFDQNGKMLKKIKG
jgi:hypothetical protein